MPPALRHVLRAAIWVSPPFVLVIAALALSLAGLLELDPRITWRSALVLNALLYWALAAAAVAALCNPRAVFAFVRGHAGRLAMLGVSLAVSLFVAEKVAEQIVARTHGWRLEPSTPYHHRNPASVRVRDNTGSVVTTNADGFRTHWTREAFGRHRRRVALVGDSFTFGLGVNDDETVPVQLERILRDRLGTEDLAVLNAGTISWSPLTQRRAFRELVVPYRPTLTLLLLDATDIGDDYHYGLSVVPGSNPESPDFVIDEDEYRRPPALATLAEPVLGYLRAPGIVLQRFRGEPLRSAGYYQFELPIGGTIETNRWFILRHPLELTRPFFETTLSYIRQMARDAEAAGSDFLLVVTPRYFQWNDQECPDDWSLDQRGRDEPHEMAYFDFFDEAAGRESFPILSLLPAFQATDRFPLVLRNDAHWNPDGNLFVAETLADEIVERGLVD